VLVSALPVGVGVLFKYGLGAGGEAVGAMLLTCGIGGAFVALFVEGVRQGNADELSGLLPVKAVLSIAMVAAPLFV
jgi:hypothetical protein